MYGGTGTFIGTEPLEIVFLKKAFFNLKGKIKCAIIPYEILSSLAVLRHCTANLRSFISGSHLFLLLVCGFK